LPPAMALFEISALAGGQIGARFRDGMERVKSDAGAEFIDVGGVGKSPGTNAAVAVVIKPLCTETLRPVLVKSDAVFEVGGVPLRNAIFGSTRLQKPQDVTLELRFTDGMLRNEPGGFGSVFADEVFGRPAVLGDEFAEPSGVLDVDGFHTGNVMAAEFIGVEEFLANALVFRAHDKEFEAHGFVRHRFTLSSL